MISTSMDYWLRKGEIMKGKKINKVSVLICILVLFILIVGFIFLSRSKQIKKYTKYSTYIIVETTKEKEIKKYEINCVDDGEGTRADLSYFNNPIFIKDGKTYYPYKGQYKRIFSNDNYTQLYDSLSQINIKSSDGYYNIDFPSGIVNEIFDSLFIDTEIVGQVQGNITLENDKIKDFSVYFDNIRNFDKLSIKIIFEELPKNFKIDLPIFYEEVTSAADKEVILIKWEFLFYKSIIKYDIKMAFIKIIKNVKIIENSRKFLNLEKSTWQKCLAGDIIKI